MTEPTKPSEWAEMATPSELRVAEMMAARDYSLRALVVILLLFFASLPYIFFFSTILAIVLSSLWYSDATDAEALLQKSEEGAWPLQERNLGSLMNLFQNTEYGVTPQTRL